MKYEQLWNSETDKQQTKFVNGEIETNKSRVMIEKSKIDFSVKVLCPFCLNVNTLDKFQKDRAWYKCPDCNQLLTVKTCVSIIKMNPKQFAKWVFEYRLSGFFGKIDFKKWNTKLWELGVSKEFWEEYKLLRGDSTQEEEQEINDDYDAMLKNTEKEE
jgi:transposase-like protein